MDFSSQLAVHTYHFAIIYFCNPLATGLNMHIESRESGWDADTVINQTTC